MPAPEISHRYQVATLFPFLGYDSYGQPTIGVPIEIRVRWNDVRREVLDKQGNSIAVDATAIVNQKILIGSHIWLGSLESWVGTGSGLIENDLMEVKTYNETPDIKNRFSQKTIGMIRLHDRS